MHRFEIACDEGCDPFDALEWLRAHARVGEPVARRRREAWYDTPTGELAAAGVVAAVITRDTQREVALMPVPVDDGELDACVGNRVSLDHDEPAAVIRAECARLGLPLTHVPGEQLVLDVIAEVRRAESERCSFEISREVVRVVGRDRDADLEGLRIRMIEGDRIAMVGLVSAMFRALDVQPRSLLERVRRAAGLPAMRWSGRPPPFDPTLPVERVARAAGGALWQAIRAHEPGARIGLDAEHVHKLRVAIRRLRAALRVFEDAFDEGEGARLVEELGALGRVAGRVRDLDVQALSLGRRAAGVGGPTMGWALAAAAVEALRDSARADLRAALTGAPFAAVCARVERVLAPSDAPSSRSVAAVVGDIVGRRIHRFDRALTAFADEPTAERAHRLRIAGKNLRYALELLRSALPRLDEDVLDRFATFQDRLGLVQDDVQLGALATELAGAAPGEPAMAWAVGALAGTSATARKWARPIVERAIAELDPETTIAAIERAVRADDE
jgi:CHAD domain-containing protein